MRTTCIQCKGTFDVPPYRAGTAKFCSYRCRGAWRSENWAGASHPGWKGGQRTKSCRGCGLLIKWAGQPLTTFRRQKFCSKPCADKHGKRLRGDKHPNWTGGTHKRDSRHATWAERVITRDGSRCQTCGATGVELHAHHIQGWKEEPSARYKLSNGITLCARCHWAVHSASNANAVNSGNPQHELGGGNPEPSPGRKVREGVTTRGRAYRRVDASCAECGCFISRRASDAKGRTNLFCSKRCMGRHYSKTRSGRKRQ